MGTKLKTNPNGHFSGIGGSSRDHTCTSVFKGRNSVLLLGRR
jgi:hypothetical protein